MGGEAQTSAQCVYDIPWTTLKPPTWWGRGGPHSPAEVGVLLLGSTGPWCGWVSHSVGGKHKPPPSAEDLYHMWRSRIPTLLSPTCEKAPCSQTLHNVQSISFESECRDDRVLDSLADQIIILWSQCHTEIQVDDNSCVISYIYKARSIKVAFLTFLPHNQLWPSSYRHSRFVCWTSAC